MSNDDLITKLDEIDESTFRIPYTIQSDVIERFDVKALLASQKQYIKQMDEFLYRYNIMQHENPFTVNGIHRKDEVL